MRPGQTQPLIHFDPAVRGQPLHLIRLDGEVLDFADPADVRIVEFDGSSQKALEFQRHPAENMDHTIEMTYRLDLPQGYPRFSPDVNDIEGIGNEEIFPTLNTPHELARHRIFINVHGSSPFRCLGSGLVEPVSGPVQAWVLDSEREVASYTLFFVVVPAEDVQYRTRTINDVEVRAVRYDYLRFYDQYRDDWRYFDYTLSVKGYAPMVGLHLTTRSRGVWQLEGFLGGGPLFATCLHFQGIEWRHESYNGYWQGDWVMEAVKAQVYWGQFQFHRPTVYYDGLAGAAEDFDLDLSGFRLKLGLSFKI